MWGRIQLASRAERVLVSIRTGNTRSGPCSTTIRNLLGDDGFTEALLGFLMETEIGRVKKGVLKKLYGSVSFVFFVCLFLSILFTSFLFLSLTYDTVSGWGK